MDCFIINCWARRVTSDHRKIIEKLTNHIYNSKTNDQGKKVKINSLGAKCKWSSLDGRTLCFNHTSHHQLLKPKQMLQYYLCLHRFTQRYPAAAQWVRLARWWKDQARRWTDRISCGAWLCENWVDLTPTPTAELHRLSYHTFLRFKFHMFGLKVEELLIILSPSPHIEHHYDFISGGWWGGWI